MRNDCPQKILDILTGRGFVAPDAYDDLPALIRWSADLLRDPWVPLMWHGELRNMLIAANEQLMLVQNRSAG